ncbi:hypothetical protein CCACVL1_28268 [Corchorus capsularis]|uniref:Uncharacterized protein n=1 Tax=Corchorus capsularis TaxID=210143 RepID=A0A1R3G727_COCAP|nr:hypothetical protein CCACVL1_28268 [Corchorus capsularis]
MAQLNEQIDSTRTRITKLAQKNNDPIQKPKKELVKGNLNQN